MTVLLFIPYILQVLCITFDEWFFHRNRVMPKWERIGHPLDTLTVLICFLYVLLISYSSFALKGYIALGLFSCIFVTKDEFVHKDVCSMMELWLHALLFVNHSILLGCSGVLWAIRDGALKWREKDPMLSCSMISLVFIMQCLFIAAFGLYQLIYWNFINKDRYEITKD